MSDPQMMVQMAGGAGFLAALDQSGGSTPGALKAYGISESAYHDDIQMFDLMHAMRVRIMTAPAFTGAKVLAAILFERTMDGEAEKIPVPAFLWQRRGVVPFLKVDHGLEAASDGVRLMKPIKGLDQLLQRAVGLGVFGTKMRSVIDLASKAGIAAIVKQQFEIGQQIASYGLVPILEPEATITSDQRASAEDILLDELVGALDAWPAGMPVMIKLSIPVVPNHYASLTGHPKVMRVVALSGGYSRDEACAELAKNHGMIASFSRALVEDLRHQMDEAAFDAALAAAIDQIYTASTVKV